MNLDVLPGQSFPLGANIRDGGVNFCVFSPECESMELLLFNDEKDAKPDRVIRFDPKTNKTFYYWHVFVGGIGAGQIYAFRAYGPYEPDHGHRFDGTKVLLDPYGRAVVGDSVYDRNAAIGVGDNCAHAFKNVVADTQNYNWGDDVYLNLPYSETVIYELHVGGFTKHPNSGVAENKRGTYAGLVEKIPYLQELGITAVELMPVQQFDDQDAPGSLPNYWGYSPVAFFAPHRGYSSRQDSLGPLYEFRDMVKAFHKAGIEVILDVVFNHTAEGNEDGPTFSFKGLSNFAYYILEKDLARYANYSGCGNTFNANHSVVRRLIRDCLCYWVAEMHVDGFRFDLASVLARGETGEPLENPPVLWSIESEPALAGTKLIAEAWDAGGLYQVGTFVGHKFAEWNGPFRDDVRRFIKGDAKMVKRFSERITASPDLYLASDREPNRSINFITCHDGFTLNDLVSYNKKHNEANGENNQDGTDSNWSWNCGAEGPTDDVKIEQLRIRQIKNFIMVLFLSQGTPMLLMGDEVRRTQNGNNNAYCQDNETSWFDWRLVGKNEGLLRFIKELIAFTQERAVFREEEFWISPGEKIKPQITWHGTRLCRPDWGNDSHSLAFSLKHEESGDYIHIIQNAYWKKLVFELPPLPSTQAWFLIVDTSKKSPEDFCAVGSTSSLGTNSYSAGPRSVVMLFAGENATR
ncbi:MAG: glycogen debranching protein GlgX [Calditrichaeota bacterium]|nr:glycogen debranching protein GlgX [Calditrichota bacterium]